MAKRIINEDPLLDALMYYFNYFNELARFPISSTLTDEQMIEALNKAVETDTKIVDTVEYIEGRDY